LSSHNTSSHGRKKGDDDNNSNDDDYYFHHHQQQKEEGENNNNNYFFMRIYSQAVKEAMSILGESAILVTNYLEEKYSITLEETANEPQKLTEALDAAIDGGARIVQRRILRLIYERLDLKPPTLWMMTDFEGKLQELERHYKHSKRADKNNNSNSNSV
jgi:hypothetical protein